MQPAVGGPINIKFLIVVTTDYLKTVGIDFICITRIRDIVYPHHECIN